jgi:hypothetical protein
MNSSAHSSVVSRDGTSDPRSSGLSWQSRSFPPSARDFRRAELKYPAGQHGIRLGQVGTRQNAINELKRVAIEMLGAALDDMAVDGLSLPHSRIYSRARDVHCYSTVRQSGA